MFEFKRSSTDNVKLKLGDEVLTVHLWGMKQAKEFRRASSRLNELQTRIKEMQESGNEVSAENIELLEQAMNYMNEVIFGQAITQKLNAFFDGNFDELMKIELVFIKEVFAPALDRQIKKMSEEKAKEYDELLELSAYDKA